MAIVEVISSSLSWTGLAFLLFIVFVLCAIYFRLQSPRRKRNVPYVTGYLPWIGPVLEIYRDINKFVSNQQQKLGDVFFAVVAGKRMLFICNHLAVAEIWRQSNTLSFEKVKEMMFLKPFGPGTVEFFTRLGTEADEPFKTNLRGHDLLELNTRFHDSLRALLGFPPLPGSNKFFYEQDVSEVSVGLNHKSWPGQGTTWHRVDLTAMMHFITAAHINAFYGPNVCTPQLQEDLATFNGAIDTLSSGIPEWLPLPKIRAAVQARTRLLELSQLQELGPKCSTLPLARRALIVDKAGLPQYKTLTDLGINLAATLNTNQTHFWVLAQLLTCPDALDAIKLEAEEVLGPVGTFSTDELTLKEQLERLVKLNAFINEILRYYYNSFNTRIALEDTELSFAGQKVYVQKGDFIMISGQAIHHDKSVYGKDVDQFCWDRFLSDDKKSAKKFIDQKTGNTISNHLLSFGGGSNACPGQMLARGELKITTLTLLALFDITLDEANQSLPQASMDTIGIRRPVKEQPFWVKMRLRDQNK